MGDLTFGDISNAVWYNESRRRMEPGIYGDYVNGKPTAYGPMQVHGPALADVNKAWGTNYTLQELADNPELGLKVGNAYLAQQHERFPNPLLAIAAYQAGPGTVERAGGKVPNPAYVASAAKFLGLPGYDSLVGTDPQAYVNAGRLAGTQATPNPFTQAPSAPWTPPPPYIPTDEGARQDVMQNPLIAALLAGARRPMRAIPVDYDPFAAVGRRMPDVPVQTDESRMGSLPMLPAGPAG